MLMWEVDNEHYLMLQKMAGGEFENMNEASTGQRCSKQSYYDNDDRK